MSDELFTADLDVASVRTRSELAALLRTVHVRADRPSLRSLETRTRHERAPLSKTVVSEMLKGARFPRKAVMISFLRACGIPEETMDVWRRSWERVAGSEQIQVPPEGADEESGESAHRPVAEDRADALRTSLADGGASRAIVAASPGSDPVVPRDHGDRLSPVRGIPGPLARRRELGALLRGLRSSAELTIEQVAANLMCSTSKVSRMETGFRSGTLRDIRDLCDLYQVTDGSRRDYLMELAREAKRQGWWQSYDLPFGFGTYVGLEADAASISSYQAIVIPGLVQTEEYARAILVGAYSDRGGEWIEEMVAVRLRRQNILVQDCPSQLSVLLDESALRRIIGSPAIMRAQLNHLIAQAGLPNITLQVIPYRAGAYPAMDSSFTILGFPASMHDIAYAEGVFGFIYIERLQDVARCRQFFHDLREIALDNQESIDFVAGIIKDLSKLT